LPTTLIKGIGPCQWTTGREPVEGGVVEGEVQPRNVFVPDATIAKRLRNYIHGTPTLLVPCTWKRKSAVVAVMSDGLAFVSGGMSGRSAAALIQASSFEPAGGKFGKVRIGGDVFDIEFSTEADSHSLILGIQSLREKRRDIAGAIRLGEHERVVRKATYLGGAHLRLAPGSIVDLVFRDEALEVYTAPAMRRQSPIFELSYGASFTVELTGPGKVTKGGGYVGGGVGLVGAVEGIAIAALLNAVTTKTSIVTVIVVADAAHEGFFVVDTIVPEELRRILSPTFVRLRQHQTAAVVQPAVATEDLVAKLERLAALRTAGLINEDEFAAAKNKLLSSP
jgi:hypothetical protein